MASVNMWVGLGNMTRDPEVRVTPKGDSVAAFSIACNTKWKDQAGNMQEEVFFMDCDAWGKLAEVVSMFAKKGQQVHVMGRLKTEKWEDKQTGQERSKIKCTVSSFTLCGSRSDASPEANRPPVGKAAATRPPGASERYQSPDLPKQTNPIQDDDQEVPF